MDIIEQWKIKLIFIIHKLNINHVQPTLSSSEEGNKGSSLMSISDSTDISVIEKIVDNVIKFSLNFNMIKKKCLPTKKY